MRDCLWCAQCRESSRRQALRQTRLMTFDLREDDNWIDPSVNCSDCEAVCCRLLVFITPDDRLPQPTADANEPSPEVMARAEDGWCVAMDRLQMRCGIYEARPGACRRFTMGAGYCRAVREDYRRRAARDIPHVLLDAN